LRKSNTVHSGDWHEPDAAGVPEDTPLFSPRADPWSDHFEFAGNAIIGKTATGRFTILLLRMNAPRILEARDYWTAIGLYP